MGSNAIDTTWGKTTDYNISKAINSAARVHEPWWEAIAILCQGVCNTQHHEKTSWPTLCVGRSGFCWVQGRCRSGLSTWSRESCKHKLLREKRRDKPSEHDWPKNVYITKGLKETWIQTMSTFAGSWSTLKWSPMESQTNIQHEDDDWICKPWVVASAQSKRDFQN